MDDKADGLDVKVVHIGTLEALEGSSADSPTPNHVLDDMQWELVARSVEAEQISDLVQQPFDPPPTD